MASDLQTIPSQDAYGSKGAEGTLTKEAGALAIADAKQLPANREQVLDDAIARYGQGESVYAIADGLGINHTTLYRQLVKHRETDWRDAKVSRALLELEDAEEALKTAPDALALTRARERCRAAQWQLERLMRRIYGQDAQAATQAVQININMRGSGATNPDVSVTQAKTP